MSNIFENSIEIKEIIVHAGIFHADDVSCVALMELVSPCVNIRREFRVDVDSIPDGTIICDIGGICSPQKRVFDHHFKELPVHRDLETPMCAFGMLWEWIAPQLGVSEAIHDKFEDEIVIPISSQDNGKSKNPLSLMVGGFNPSWDSGEKPDDCFNKAVEVVKTMFSAWFSRAFAEERGEEIINTVVEETAISDHPEIAVFNQYVPTGTRLVETPILFTVSPSVRGGWNATTVKAEIVTTGFAPDKLPFPKEWRGVPEETLRQMNPGMSFCHPNGFIIACDTQEQAIGYCKKAIEMA